MNEEFVYDYSKLRGKIKEIFKTQTAFAKEIPINEATLSNKLNNNVEFTQKEMNKICDLFNQPYSVIPIYFFTHKVQETEQRVTTN